MLRLENVTKHYKDFTLNCSMEVKAGTVTGLIGANGAGKSTLLRMISGVLKADHGQILIDDENIFDFVFIFALRQIKSILY